MLKYQSEISLGKLSEPIMSKLNSFHWHPAKLRKSGISKMICHNTRDKTKSRVRNHPQSQAKRAVLVTQTNIVKTQNHRNESKFYYT